MSEELAFIDQLRGLPLHPGARGLNDDAAVLEIGGETLVITHDMMAEGVHWLPGTDEADIAHKLVATNLSDLAAKGAEPIGALLAFGLDDPLYNKRFAHWVGKALKKYDMPLLGGDTIAAGKRVVGMTAIGRATHTPVPARSGASPGENIWLCGHIGDAMIGHGVLKGAMASVFMQNNTRVTLDPYFTARFLRPEPLLAQGQALAPQVSAMMDVSDGLLLDAMRMAEASDVTLALSYETMPFSPQFLASLDGNQLDVKTDFRMTKEAAMRWGDDYALLFTAPPSVQPPVEAVRIGTVERAGKHRVTVDGNPPADDEPLGYQHRR